jgi:hypothetical protein
MKVLIAAVLMIVSFSTYSSEMGSVDSLLSVLPLGTYSGVDEEGNSCGVNVNAVNFPEKVLSVVVFNNKARIFKIINDGTVFQFREYKKEFIQSERQYVDSTRSTYVDRIIRTSIAGANTLYVVVANELTINRDRTVESVECVVKL